MVTKIVDKVVDDVFKTRWFCPICDHFDTIPSFDEREVKKHIAVRHGEPLLDMRLSSLHGDYQCNQRGCFKLYDSSDDLLTHLAFDHTQLLPKVLEMDLNISDYQPLPRTRKGKEMRYNILFFFLKLKN